MSPEITITSEELRERVEDRLDRWIPDDVWNRAEPYDSHKNEINRQKHTENDNNDTPPPPPQTPPPPPKT